MIADFGDYLRAANRRFADQHITVDQDWLGGCVEWFISENPQISNEDLYKNAYEQWLLSDLVESGIQCLPQTVLSNKMEFELTGNYALQMQYLIDIAESAYEQYRNLHDKKLDEAEETETEQRQRNIISKKKRMLKLELTDGHSTVIAMEHCPISCLNTKLYPGTKILIKGPMRCANKVLFLQPKNVKVLGGEVEKQTIDNAYENVLLKAMGRPITSTPKLDYNETVIVEQNGPISILPTRPLAVHNQPAPTNIIQDDDDDLFSNLDIDNLNTNVVANNATNANQNRSTNVNQFLDDDDDIFFEANIPDATVTESATTSNANRNHNLFDDDDDFDVLEVEANIQMEMENEERRNQAKNKVMESCTKPAVQSSPENNKYSDRDFDFDEIFTDHVIEDDRATVSQDITDSN